MRFKVSIPAPEDSVFSLDAMIENTHIKMSHGDRSWEMKIVGYGVELGGKSIELTVEGSLPDDVLEALGVEVVV